MFFRIQTLFDSLDQVKEPLTTFLLHDVILLRTSLSPTVLDCCWERCSVTRFLYSFSYWSNITGDWRKSLSLLWTEHVMEWVSTRTHRCEKIVVVRFGAPFWVFDQTEERKLSLHHSAQRKECLLSSLTFTWQIGSTRAWRERERERHIIANSHDNGMQLSS